MERASSSRASISSRVNVDVGPTRKGNRIWAQERFLRKHFQHRGCPRKATSSIARPGLGLRQEILALVTAGARYRSHIVILWIPSEFPMIPRRFDRFVSPGQAQDYGNWGSAGSPLGTAVTLALEEFLAHLTKSQRLQPSEVDRETAAGPSEPSHAEQPGLSASIFLLTITFLAVTLAPPKGYTTLSCPQAGMRLVLHVTLTPPHLMPVP